MNILNRLASDVQMMFRRPSRMQYAALCYRFPKKSDTPEMLVITSRDSGRWVIPKGWPMQGKTASEAAEREAFEEAGVKGKVMKDPLGTYVYQKKMADEVEITCKVQVYPLIVNTIAKRYPEKGTRISEWVTFTEAADRVAEPQLKDLIIAFEAVLKQRA